MRFKPSQGGVALMEMLVALVIGLVVVGAVLATYLSTGQSGRLQSAFAQMDEDAQIGLQILSSDLLMAGFGRTFAVLFADTPTNPVHYDC